MFKREYLLLLMLQENSDMALLGEGVTSSRPFQIILPSHYKFLHTAKKTIQGKHC